MLTVADIASFYCVGQNDVVCECVECGKGRGESVWRSGDSWKSEVSEREGRVAQASE